MKKLSDIFSKIIVHVKKDVIIYAFIFTSIINSLILRSFTIGKVFYLKSFLIDLTFIIIISFIGSFFKRKNQFWYFLVWSIILTAICLINAVYYSNYISFASVSLFKAAQSLGDYSDAVFENILETKDFVFIFQVFIITFIGIQNKRKMSKDFKERTNKLNWKKNTVMGSIIFALFISQLFINNINRLNQQWNRNSIVRDFGIYTYQANDIVSSVKTKVRGMVGYDVAYKKFREYYESRKINEKNNAYTNLFEGKNILVIHGESIQGFTLNLKFNDKELTPNLNRMAKEGIYFSNYYAQESVGNSSDSEFTSLTSLLPSTSGTVFTNYFNRDYETILKLLKEKDYYTFSMHANNGSAWNRNSAYKYLGYDDFYYYTKDYEIDEKIGLGLSDKSFFRQSVQKIKNINDEHKNFYGTLIMLTNHTPFSGIKGHTDYSVNYINEDGEEIEWLEDTKIGNYLKSVHYADEAIGDLFKYLDEEGILDNTIVVLYGDHDCKLKKSEFKDLYESEYYESVLIDPSDTVGVIDDFTYEINRKVPFIIWSKDIVNTDYSKEVTEVMGMIDMMPTLSNMLGVKPKYALGHDIFSLKDNIVVFPSGNWMTNKIYYNRSKNEFRQLELDSSIDMNYIQNNNDYAEELIDISNGIITYDFIKAYEKGES